MANEYEQRQAARKERLEELASSSQNWNRSSNREGFKMTSTEPGDDLARQTAQGKLLREARASLGVTSQELADQLGVSLPTLRSWMSPHSAKVRREMPKTAKLLLAYVLKEARKQAK